MKSLFSLSLLLASSAFAHPVAQVIVSDGYIIRPSTETITLDSDGTVTAVLDFRTPESTPITVVQNVDVAKLNGQIVDNLVKDAATIQSTNLLSDHAPSCRNAAVTEFFAYNPDGSHKKIGQELDCVGYYPENNQGRRTIEILKSLRTLYRNAR